MPDAQTIWNAVTGLFALLVTGALSLLRDNLKNMQSEIKSNSAHLHAVQLLVTGDYVKKDDLDRTLERIFNKLELIDSKLDTKVSREECPIIHGANK
jgi:hypothetical protein